MTLARKKRSRFNTLKVITERVTETEGSTFETHIHMNTRKKQIESVAFMLKTKDKRELLKNYLPAGAPFI